MGQVLTAGVGQIPARQAAVAAGIPMTVPAITINKVCLSGLNAIAMADQLIRAGEFEIIVAGGQESMSNAPHLLPKSREGFKYGDVTLRDHLAYDGLHDVFTDQAMGNLTEAANVGDEFVNREEQDEFAAASHQRAAKAWKDGIFDDEVVPVSVPQRRGEPVVVATDEGMRADTTVESLSRLRPSFAKDGTITAGSSSQLSDGATAVLVMSKTKAEEMGLTWIAEIGPYGVVAGPDSTLQSQPARAIVKACERAGVEPTELDLDRDQRGVRRSRDRVRAGVGPGFGEGQRQRRCHCPWAPDRRLRCPDRPAPGTGTEAARRRCRCRGALRWRRTG